MVLPTPAWGSAVVSLIFKAVIVSLILKEFQNVVHVPMVALVLLSIDHKCWKKSITEKDTLSFGY